jgi:hypothetical protein
MDRSGTSMRGGRRSCAVALTVLVPMVLAACTAAPAVSGQPGTPPARSSEAPGHVAGDAFPSPLPPPTDDPGSRRSAVEQATAAVTAFARPGVDPETWWAELAPLLSPAALEAYSGTDPAEVPAREVTGPAWPGESASSYLATVFVPTDAGEYAVLLVREGGDAPWLVERISQVRPASPEVPEDAPTELGA